MHTLAWFRVLGGCVLSGILVAAWVLSQVVHAPVSAPQDNSFRIDMYAGAWGGNNPFIDHIEETLGINERIVSAQYEVNESGEVLILAPISRMPTSVSPLLRYTLDGRTLIVSTYDAQTYTAPVLQAFIGAPRTVISLPGTQARFVHGRGGLAGLVGGADIPRALTALKGDMITPPFLFADFVRAITPQTEYRDRGVVGQLGMSEHAGSLALRIPDGDRAPEEELISAILGTLMPSTATARLPDGTPLREVVSGKDAITISHQGEEIVWNAGAMKVATGYQEGDTLVVSVGNTTSSPLPGGCRVSPSHIAMRIRPENPFIRSLLMIHAPLMTTVMLPPSGLDISLGHDEIGGIYGCLML